MLRFFRKKLKVDNEELDNFLGSTSTSTKYYLEKTFTSNKIIKYLLFLRIKGANLNTLFDEELKNNYKEYKKWKK